MSLSHGRFATLCMTALLAMVASTGEASDLDLSQFMFVDEIRPGQEAIGLSVFQGSTPDTFEIDILGVMEDVGPGRDMILGRARGEFLEHTGIIAGMSGTPVYVNGRLIGATAFAWTFAKEPMVGITPIGEMLGILEYPGSSKDMGMEGISGERPRFALRDLTEPVMASEARPIQTPIALSGFSGPAREVWQSFLSTLGFVAVEGGGRAPAGVPEELRPGSAMGIQMVRGDMTSTAIGTVTWVSGERVLVLGHPFLLAGEVSVPLASAHIHAVMPSQVSSFKIGAPGPSIGSVRQDRQAGVMGVLGSEASMIPVSVTVSSAAGGPTDEFHFEVIRSDILTSSMIGLVGFSSVEASQKGIGESTLGIRTRIRMSPGESLESEIAVASPAPPLAVAEQIGWPIQSLIENPFERVRIEEVHIDVSVLDRFRVAALEDLRVDRTRVKPGEDLQVWVTLRPYREPRSVKRISVHVPEDTPAGPLDLVACASGDLWDVESERAPLRFEPANLDQLIELLGSRRDTKRVYVQLFQRRDSRVMGGRELPRLPGSMLSVLDSGIRTGQTGASAGAVLLESEIETEWVVVGCKGIQIQVKPR